MTTTTASKAGLRATATAKRTKAAQRTPLPPKNLKEIIADVQEPIAAPKTPRKRAQKAVPAPVAPVVELKPTKANGYADQLAALGWKPEITRTENLVELVATREGEALYLAWMNEAHVSGTSTYTIADRTVKVRNPAEAMRIANQTPVEAEAKQQKVASNRQFRKRATGPTIRTIPFDIKNATTEQIIDAIEGRKISWHNRYAVTSETATVGSRKCITVTNHPEGHVIVSFVDPENGYRAFRLDALENVGRKVDLARIKQQIIASLARELKKSKAAA